MDTKKTREEWINWLMNERYISATIMNQAKLNINVENAELEIPVMDGDGLFLFNKYRRSPWNGGGPKYRYETGSTAALYGAETLASMGPGEGLVITEGELDALALRSYQNNAVSSTGGSGTWRQEWSSMLTEFGPIICYDADRAGVEGAMRVASMVPHARIAWLPVQYGKDPTEIIASGHYLALKEALTSARHYNVPGHGIEQRIDKLKILLKTLYIERKDIMSDPERTPLLIDIAVQWTEKQIEGEKDVEKYRTRENLSAETATAIEKAKTYPIGKLIKVSKDGFAKCIYHEESTSSMKVYAIDNHAYSYCCSRRSDAIDIYKELNNCSFKEAVNALVW